MTKTVKEPTEPEIINAYNSGTLLSYVLDRLHSLNNDARRAFTKTCTRLHNDEKINLLSLVKYPNFDEIEGHLFFSCQHFFCKAIPDLNATTTEMMTCVDYLVSKAGADLAANLPNVAFRDWCKRNTQRSLDVLESAKHGDPLSIKFLTFALTAGNMLQEAIGFAENFTDERRLAGITALGRMNNDNSTSARKSLSTLLNVVENTSDESVCANILMSALDIAKNNDLITFDDTRRIVEIACKAQGLQLQIGCARALGQYYRFLTEEVVILLLMPLRSLDSSHKEIVQELDYALGNLLDTPFGDHGIEYITALLSSPQNTFNLSDFPAFARKLIGAAGERFHRVFVSWLLSGIPELCGKISDVLRDLRRDATPIDLPIKGLTLSPEEQMFLCRKAIGYLFLQPVVAGSIVVSVLRYCDDEVAQVVTGLLFDPLLLNYGGDLKDYLDRIHDNDPAYPHVRNALDRNVQYLTNVRSTGNINELHPSEHQRQTYRLHFHDEMRSAQKKAEKESVLFDLVSRSVVLYGKRSLTYVESPSHERKVVETELKSHSVTFELPRMELIDPVGLDLMLRMLRAERLKP